LPCKQTINKSLALSYSKRVTRHSTCNAGLAHRHVFLIPASFLNFDPDPDPDPNPDPDPDSNPDFL
jgi:hypothetical protein